MVLIEPLIVPVRIDKTLLKVLVVAEWCEEGLRYEGSADGVPPRIGYSFDGIVRAVVIEYQHLRAMSSRGNE